LESAAFKPGTATLAVGLFNGDVELWNTATRKITGILHDPKGRADETALVAFAPGGTTMAVGDGAGGDVYLWDTAHQAAVLTATLATPADVSGQGVTAVAFGPGGLLAVAYSRGRVYLWDTATKRITAILPGPAGDDGGTLTAFGPGRTLAVGYSSGNVDLWDIAKFQEIATLTGPPGVAGTAGVGSLAFGPGGKTMAVGYENGDAYLWDTASELNTAAVTPPADVQGPVAVALGPGANTLAVGYGNGDTRLWDSTTKKTTEILHEIGPKTSEGMIGGVSGCVAGGGVSALAFGPGGMLAVGAANCDVYLWPARG
jgi:WD40 repeat protein